MSKMPGAALILVTVLVSVSSRGSAEAQQAPSHPEPLTTGRALIDVRTPSLPAADGEIAKERRRAALDISRDRLAAVAERNDIQVAARSVPGGFIAVDLGGRSIDRLRAELS